MKRSVNILFNTIVPFALIIVLSIMSFITDNIFFLIIAILMAIIGIIFAINTSKNIKRLNQSVEELANGNLNTNILTVTGDFADVSKNLKLLQSSINNTLDEMESIGNEVIRGTLTKRGKLSRIGDFDRPIIAVNELVEAMQMCYDHMRHPMQILDKNAKCTHINPTIISYGYSINDIGKTMAQMYNQELHDNYIKCFKEIETTKKPYLMRTETPTSQGLIIEENFIWPIFSAGTIVSYGNITLDITDSVRFREITDKIIKYQKNEADAITIALEGSASGELNFNYMPADYDDDTLSTFESFHQMKDNITASVDITKSYVDDIVDAMQKMANNDFDFSMTKNYLGDFAPIKKSIHTMIDSVSKLMETIQDTSVMVKSTSNDIANEEASLANHFRQQADTIKDVTRILSELSTKAQDSAHDAKEVKKLSLEINRTAEKGNISMRNLGNAMEEIKQSSSQIAKIAKMVEDIAFQTTLLSLNASIEAARAGEAGAGFAVVAEEVRNLASRSTHAAKETTEMVQTSIDNIEKGYALANQTAQVLDEIVHISVNETNGLANIAIQSDAQVKDMVNISSKMEEISEMTSLSTNIVARNASECQNLADLAVQLEDKISQFRIRKILTKR